MRISACFIAVILCFISCSDSDVLGSKKFDLGGNWGYNTPVIAEFDFSDSVVDFVVVSLRLTYNDEYPFENIYLKSTITSATDTILNEVKSFPLQNDIGQWIGEKVSKGYTIKLPLIEKMKKSDLRLTVNQHSRENVLKGINSVELLIEK